MQSEWLLARIYEIQRNETCEILKKPLEYSGAESYESLLIKVDEALFELKKPGGGYIPPLSKGRRKQLIKELRTIKKYILLKTK